MPDSTEHRTRYYELAARRWQEFALSMQAERDQLAVRLENLEAEKATLESANALLQVEVDRWRAMAGGRDPVEPDPDPGDPGEDPVVRPGEPWTFAWFGKSAAEKKEARPPAWPDSGAGGVVRSFAQYATNESFVLEDATFELPDYVQKAVANGAVAGERGVSATLRNLLLGDAPAGLKWMARLYNLEDAVIERCVVEGRMSEKGRPAPMEHLAYLCVNGATRYSYNFARALGGKLLYVAHRPFAAKGYPPQNLRYATAPHHKADGNVAIDCEMDASRGSYSFTWFDAGDHEHPATIEMTGNVCVSEWEKERSQGANDYTTPSNDPWRVQSCGAFMVSNYVWLGAGHTVERFTLQDNLIHMVRARHPVGVVRDARHVIIRDNCIETTDHQNPHIEVGGKDAYAQGMTPPETVTVRNNLSNGVSVRVWEADGTAVVHPLHSPGVEYLYTRESGKFTEV